MGVNMTNEEKRLFVNELIASTAQEIHARLQHTPEEWDDIELREYVAEMFARASYGFNQQPRKRKAEYKNALMVRPL
jgi:hypothetical protein